jgi:hypothetical protein
MRRSQWYREGETARLIGEPRHSNPYDGDPAHYVRRRAWFQGWDEGEANEERRNPPPTGVEAAIAEGNLSLAVDLADDLHDLKAILRAAVEWMEARP